MTQRTWLTLLPKFSCELLSNLYLCIGWHSLSPRCHCRWWLWIAFKFVSLYRMTQLIKLVIFSEIVVNCFQICIFVSDDTAAFNPSVCASKLWIAFKFVSLYRMTQPESIQERRQVSCELLSNLYLCIGWHSLATKLFAACELWIAFKFVSLYRMTQPARARLKRQASCELLSNLYLCIGWHSELFDFLLEVLLWIAFKFVSLYRMTQQGSSSPAWARVVNCFQICIFVSDDTAQSAGVRTFASLWIAFKFVSLYRMTQPRAWQPSSQSCCELLSNLYLCIGWHSTGADDKHDAIVVNCFQICIFVSDDTADDTGVKRCNSCELLSNLYLCIGWHSRGSFFEHIKLVVNCFQICIFVSDDTAINGQTYIDSRLWIAFKFVSLYRMTQQINRENKPPYVVNCFQICIFVSDDTADHMNREAWERCELLSNLYLCIGWHSFSKTLYMSVDVVNCFQICIFVSDDTAGIDNFKAEEGCELLSNLYLCIGWHSEGGGEDTIRQVVNCFQICIFVSDDTAPARRLAALYGLWIAFKFVSLYRMTQPNWRSFVFDLGCELLSNLYLCIGWHSHMARHNLF